MKKTSLAVTLPLLAFAVLLLSGCGMFRSHKAWQTAKQESPLEIPPGLDTPSASAAMEIPPPGSNQPTAAGVTASVNGQPSQLADGFVTSADVDATYQRIGQLLAAGGIGQLQSHDDATHSYVLVVQSAPTETVQHGFFGRLLGRGKSSTKQIGPVAPHQVSIGVSSSGQNASEVRVQGDPSAVAKTVDALRAKLGS